MSLGTTAARSRARTKAFDIWTSFLAEHGRAPYFQSSKEALPWLLVYAHCYREGKIAPLGQPVRSRTVEDSLRLVAQAHQMVGLSDIRLLNGDVDYRLSQLLAAFSRQDPPPFRVKPIPLAILRRAAYIARSRNTPKADCAADMMWLAFFFLLRPGEYTAPTSEDSSPFRWCDANLFIGPCCLPSNNNT
jgi:hypothetical protein